MEDSRIIALFWERDETAVAAAQEKYGRYCHAIAAAILGNGDDADEVVNDTLTGAWNSIPPNRPEFLSTYLGKIARRLAIGRLRSATAEKRGGGEVPLTLDELAECVPDGTDIAGEVEARALSARVDAFLATLSTAERRVFLCRYWYHDPVSAIADRFGYSESKVKMMLKRTRDKLARQLEKEEMLP